MSIRGNGKTMLWKAKVYILGQMGGSIKESIRLIKKKDMESTYGRMVENIKDSGAMVRNMEKEKPLPMTDFAVKGNGKMVNSING